MNKKRYLKRSIILKNRKILRKIGIWGVHYQQFYINFVISVSKGMAQAERMTFFAYELLWGAGQCFFYLYLCTVFSGSLFAAEPTGNDLHNC